MAGTDRNRELMTGGAVDHPDGPRPGENIGMVARAMANFGLSNLRIVNPRDGWPNEKAISAASPRRPCDCRGEWCTRRWKQPLRI